MLNYVTNNDCPSGCICTDGKCEPAINENMTFSFQKDGVLVTMHIDYFKSYIDVELLVDFEMGKKLFKLYQGDRTNTMIAIKIFKEHYKSVTNDKNWPWDI